jgi:multidrug resistance efflux pump
VDLTNSESEYLKAKATREQAEATLEENKIQMAEYQKDVLDLSEEFDQKKQDYEIKLREAQKNLESQIASWENLYILRAPNNGHVSFLKYWSEGHFVNANEEVIAVVSEQQKLVGKLYLPQTGSGKVKVGQTVNIKLDNYPFREFGVIRASIDSISPVPRNNEYLVRVDLPQDLQTTYGKRLEFKQEMQGMAEIITDDLRLVERLFQHLHSLWSN